MGGQIRHWQGWVAAVLMLAGMPASLLRAQWTYLGDSLLTASGVSSHFMTLDPQWHPYVVQTIGGAVSLEWFDGQEWRALSAAGLPTSGANDCAMAFSQDGEGYIAVGAHLQVYRWDSAQWLPLGGLSPVNAAQGIQLRTSQGGKLWLAWFKAGAMDSTWVKSWTSAGGWTTAGVLEGRVLDMELDDVGEPIVLLKGAPALQHRVAGLWQAMPAFTYPDEDYIALQMSYDGTGTGAMVLRRDTIDGLSTELLSLGVWTQLGTAGFATGRVADLGLSHSGIPHVVAVDTENDGPPMAYHYVAGSWQHLGGLYVHNDAVSQPQLAFDPGAAYVLYRDEEEGQRNSVRVLGIPAAADDPASLAVMRIWPNPTSDILHLQLDRPLRGAAVEVHDLLGRVVLKQALEPSASPSIDMGQLQPGHYLLRIVSPDGGPSRPTHFIVRP